MDSKGIEGNIMIELPSNGDSISNQILNRVSISNLLKNSDIF